MRPLMILVDMDNTLENLTDAWVEALNERHSLNVKPEEITDWDVTKAFPTLTAAQVFQPIHENNFWERVKPIRGAPETLAKLINDGHAVCVVTASHYETLAAKMEKVLFRYFPFITWDEVIITSHKQLIRGDVMIDDAVHNLVNGNYEKLLMDAPHNRGFNAEAHGMTRVKTWDDIYKFVCDFSQINKEDSYG